mmetsp:Transcript_24199/g.53683  ORF Transcript_24199/g.53683 Transcript_24199/m.53683 type:complete len:726 (+) Transcript_24199:101-2278(+)
MHLGVNSADQVIASQIPGPSEGRKVSLGFLVAPKRTRQSRPLLSQERVLPCADAWDAAEGQQQADAEPEEACWQGPVSQLRGENALSGLQPVSTSRCTNRRGQGVGVEPIALLGQGSTPSRCSSIPLWARWGAPAAGPGDDISGDVSDHWTSAPGATFERISIGFKDLGNEFQDETSTCDGDGPGDEASDWEDVEGFDTAGNVVIGYREDVSSGLAFEDEGDEESVAVEEALDEPETDQQQWLTRLMGSYGPRRTLAASTAECSQGGNAVSEYGQVEDGPRVTHIVFVLHGMGATETGLERNQRDLSESLQAMQRYWFWHTTINVHVEMVDWKSVLSATQGAIFDRIMPEKAGSTRRTLNSTLSDILFYKTAYYRSKIYDIVVNRMNTRLAELQAHPSGRFSEARVSLIGHSLGSVIAYDVLSGLRGSIEVGIESPELAFEVDNFFLWGSPLAALASIADIEHQSGKFLLPEKVSTYNMFHPQDPVAFRLEPLVYHEREQVPPEVISYWANNDIRPSKQWVESYEYAKGLAHQKWTAFKSNIWEAVGTYSKADLERQQWEDFLNADMDLSSALLAARVAGGEDSEGVEVLTRPAARIDFALQEHAVESYVESYGLLQSHFSYWKSYDVALFVLKKLSRQETATLSSVEHEQQQQAAATAGPPAPEPKEPAADAPEPAPQEGQKSTSSSLLPALPSGIDVLRRLESLSCVGPRSSGEPCAAPNRPP